tara:strand:+ start:218 stop:349 length:132 start_codon:yes stop_codon:yes gene_type:complete
LEGEGSRVENANKENRVERNQEKRVEREKQRGVVENDKYILNI